jgi:hypothetical protein
LVVTKRPELVPIEHWKIRQKDAKALLTSIGNDAVLVRVMGAQYADVAKALDGTRQFEIATADAVYYQPVASMVPSTIPSTSAAMPSSPSTSAPIVAGQKRKKTPEVHGDVIDLTGESMIL